ncbi:MAG: hypothetical protein ACPG32_04090 [Akkermansiaceae bacterium]
MGYTYYGGGHPAVTTLVPFDQEYRLPRVQEEIFIFLTKRINDTNKKAVLAQCTKSKTFARYILQTYPEDFQKEPRFIRKSDVAPLAKKDVPGWHYFESLLKKR